VAELPESFPDLLPALQAHVLLKIRLPDVVAKWGEQVDKGLNQ
jgi:hypothetical protein